MRGHNHRDQSSRRPGRCAEDNQFDEYWAVDWSGGKKRYSGVAVACALKGQEPVAVILPSSEARHWTRTALVARLLRELSSGKRILVGFDFAFSFPASIRSVLGLGSSVSLPDLWAEVDRRCEEAPDYYGRQFVNSVPPEIYWSGGKRRIEWNEALRVVDRRAAETAHVQPESVLKIFGAKQVGLASLAGMRALHALRLAAGDRLALWPGPVARGQSVVVEIFPTLFRRAALGGLAKIRDGATLQRALATWDATAPRALRDSPALSDDLTDALVSAAALRHIARSPRAFDPPRDPAAAGEGWIFGVST